MPDHFEKWGLPTELVARFWKQLGEIHPDLPPVAVPRDRNKSGHTAATIPLSTLIKSLPRIAEAVRALEKEYVEACQERMMD